MKPKIECIKVTEDDVVLAVGYLKDKANQENIAAYLGCEVKDILNHLIRLQRQEWIIKDIIRGVYKIA